MDQRLTHHFHNESNTVVNRSIYPCLDWLPSGDYCDKDCDKVHPRKSAFGAVVGFVVSVRILLKSNDSLRNWRLESCGLSTYLRIDPLLVIAYLSWSLELVDDSQRRVLMLLMSAFFD